MADLTGLLDLTDVAVARSEGVLDEARRREIAEVARRVRRRSGFLGEILVVALAGGTGSGKSSLVNALAGSEVVGVGIVRPTTRHAVAVTPSDSHVDLTNLLGDLSVGEVISADALTDTVLVDLPDFDSIEDAHRHVVERVLPTVDAVVWVVDPEKYADPVIHEEFLTPLSQYAGQFIFALNHADRVGESVGSLVDDLSIRLRADGYEAPEVVATVGTGRVDVTELEQAIADRFDAKVTVLTKLAVDLRGAANDAWAACREKAAAVTGDDAATAALAAASFVSLGVEAYDFQHSIMRGSRG